VWLPFELLRRYCFKLGIDLKLPFIPLPIKLPRGSVVIWRLKTGLGVFGLLRDIWVYEEYGLPKEFQHRGWKPYVVIDGGAHVGIYSLYAAKVLNANYIVAIEPENENFRLLLLNLIKNKVRGIYLKVALYRDGIVKLKKDLASVAHSIVAKPKKPCGIESVRSISLRTLVKLLRTYHNIEQIDILKLDVEGVETILLKDSLDLLKSHEICLLLIDLTDVLRIHGLAEAKKLIELLLSIGYRVKIRRVGEQEVVLIATSLQCIGP